MQKALMAVGLTALGTVLGLALYEAVVEPMISKATNGSTAAGDGA